MSALPTLLRGFALALLLAAGGCADRDAGTASPEIRGLAASPALGRNQDVQLAYRHSLTIGLRSDRVAARFAAARDRCNGEAEKGCVLLESSLSEGRGPSGRPSASLQVRLPHDAVAPYVAFVTAPLPGEAAGDVVVRDQSTRADDVTRVIQDGTRRIAQLGDYRAKLTALSERPDISVESLIKVADELAKVQSQIEEAEAAQRGVRQRVETEIVTISLRSDETRTGPFAPVSDAWAQSGRILGESAGTALRVAVASLPWIPLVLIVFLIL
ncbi:DUF4349 domain-containing protein, partial [Methylobacterium sp. CG08_land_8_20_14_0_20_71_15]